MVFVIHVENPEGWGLTVAVKNGKSREVGGGGPREIPSMGMDIFWKHTILTKFFETQIV